MPATPSRRTPVLVPALAAALVATAGTGVARADEPRAPAEPLLLHETGEVTTVPDAFDEDDPFDIHFRLGFQQEWANAKIRRETTLNQPGLSDGGFTAVTENVASSSESRSILNFGAEVGIWHDLALYAWLPVILSDARSLGDLDGSTANPQRRADAAGNLLFPVPFQSPTRSGLDFIAAGLKYAIFNQLRDETKPTWVISVGGQFGIGPALQACNANAPAGTPTCPDPANPSQNLGAGISRAFNSLDARTTFSRRFGYLLPYTGLGVLAQWSQGRGAWSTPASSLSGAVLTNPPVVGSLWAGLEIIPWEQREQFRRLSIDLRVTGTYISPGRNYTELFDALGSSQASTLRSANPGGYTIGPDGTSVADPSKTPVYFTGVTDVQGHGAVGGTAQVTWQAGEYVKFNGGMNLNFVQGHLITSGDACNPNVTNDPDQAGPCRSLDLAAPITGIPNPYHRAVIDMPGQRFSAQDTVVVGFWVNGIVMF